MPFPWRYLCCPSVSQYDLFAGPSSFACTRLACWCIFWVFGKLSAVLFAYIWGQRSMCYWKLWTFTAILSVSKFCFCRILAFTDTYDGCWWFIVGTNARYYEKTDAFAWNTTPKDWTSSSKCTGLVGLFLCTKKCIWIWYLTKRSSEYPVSESVTLKLIFISQSQLFRLFQPSFPLSPHRTSYHPYSLVSQVYLDTSFWSFTCSYRFTWLNLHRLLNNWYSFHNCLGCETFFANVFRSPFKAIKFYFCPIFNPFTVRNLYYDFSYMLYHKDQIQFLVNRLIWNVCNTFSALDCWLPSWIGSLKKWGTFFFTLIQIAHFCAVT